MFSNGYVASRFDFKDYNEYKKVITSGKPRLFRVKVARHKSASFEPSSCQGNSTIHKTLRKRFNFIQENGSFAQIEEDHWETSYPMNMCADTPRITAVMSEKGYRDMPAIARLPIICTFGNPPSLATRPTDEVCSELARFDASKGVCVCKDPEADAKLKKPELYKDYPPGMICLSCSSREITRSVVFIVDNSGSVTAEGWQKQKEFVSEATRHLKGARTGLVEIRCESVVLLEMGLHSPDDIMSKIGPYLDDYTGTGDSLLLARNLLRVSFTFEA
ncbi:VWFA domain-containing protein [Trichostrongylus colubriformis]|uniref:VWFA domain-containing protein n=1 Tax=Trichostrongylus colubriformis TaxID=6319 RepID=A0AAN8FM61_TRICO